MNTGSTNEDNVLIQPAIAADLPGIYWLFEQAIAYQRQNNFIGWQTYDKDHLAADVDRELLFKITRESSIVCIFCVCYDDALIWRGMEKGDAVYLHRVVVHPNNRGERLFEKVLEWAIAHVKELGRKYVRMDTWADNRKIIDYYLRYGFRWVEDYRTGDSLELPAQHRNLAIALLQYSIKSQ